MMNSGVVLLVGTFLSLVPGVLSVSDVASLIAAGAAAGVMLIIVIVVIAVGASWNTWFPKWQRWKGKRKIPKSVRRRRKLLKKLSKKPIPTASAASTLRKSEIEVKDSASYIQSWNNNSKEIYADGYEEMAQSIQLEEEEEVRIVTYVTENETLNLGPFDKKEPEMTQVYDSPSPGYDSTTQELYAVVNKSVKASDEVTLSQASSGIGGSTTLNGGDQETQMQTLSFSETDPAVVVF